MPERKEPSHTVKAIAILLISFLSLASVTLCGAPSSPALERFEFSRIHMGTRFTVILYAEDAGTATRASNAAFNRVEELDATMSDYRETSELMRLCRGPGGRWVKISNDLFRVLAESQRLARLTEGAFDVTSGPMVRLWRRARRTGEMPDPQSLARAKRLTGYDQLRLDAKTGSARLDKPGMLLDLGGIAKGYAADEAMIALKRRGILRAMVVAGGDIVVSRPPPGKSGWLVGIAPSGPLDQPPRDYLLLCDRAVSTSGESEQHVEIGGVRFSHIIDPRTGLALTGHGSVTVVAPSGRIADGLATAASVLGPRRGLRLIDSIEGASGIITRATQDGVRVFESKRWGQVPKKR